MPQLGYRRDEAVQRAPVRIARHFVRELNYSE